MESNVQAGYNQVLEMIYQLPQQEINHLLRALQANVNAEAKTIKRTNKLTKMQKLLLQAPTWSDVEYNAFLERRNHFNNWRK